MRKYFIGVAAILCLILVASIALFNSRKAPTERPALSATLHERDSLIEVLLQLGPSDSVSNIVRDMLRDPNSRFIVLSNVTTPSEHQHLLWGPATRTVVLMREELRPIDTPNVYALWELIGEKYVGVGSFTVDSSKPKETPHFITTSDSVKGFAISLEPQAMGSEPKGRMVYAGMVNAEGK